MSPDNIALRKKFYIDGKWEEPSTDKRLIPVNPATEEPMGECPEAFQADVSAAVAAARRAFDDGRWSGLSGEERIGLLQTALEHLRSRIDPISRLVTDEMGAPAWMRGHFEWIDNYWDDIRDSYRAHVLVDERVHPQGRTLVVREPVGVVAAIVPWNAPLLNAIEKAFSALVTGCTCVLKPSPETPLDAFCIAEALEEAGVPPGVFNVVPGGRETGEFLISHSDVDKVSLTGSTAAGRRVGGICGEALRRTTLELGGKSAAVVLDDADIEVVASALRWGNFISSGQACNLLSRVVVVRSRYAEVIEALEANARSLRVGDPHDPATELGPLAMMRQRDRVEGLIRTALDEGARQIVGGGRPAHLSRGFYIEPTVFADVLPDMTIAREEVFGPVVAVMCCDSEEQAVQIANDSDYGLGGSVFSRDEAHATQVALRIKAGTVGINRYGTAMNAPFGGYKASGIGRTHGPEGIEEYLIVKSIGY